MRPELLIFLVILFFFQIFPTSSTNSTQKKSLSRSKRYLSFPEGATLSIALCMTAQTFLQPQELFTEAINWGISYDLPNNTAIIEDFKIPGGFVGRRRKRRDLYQNMELIMNSMGYNGRDCIYKALCETGALFKQRGEGIVQEMLRIIFGFPTQEILYHEPIAHRDYRDAHISGQMSADPDECAVRYSKCTISLIGMALGLYTSNNPFSSMFL